MDFIVDTDACTTYDTLEWIYYRFSEFPLLTKQLMTENHAGYIASGKTVHLAIVHVVLSFNSDMIHMYAADAAQGS